VRTITSWGIIETSTSCVPFRCLYHYESAHLRGQHEREKADSYHYGEATSTKREPVRASQSPKPLQVASFVMVRPWCCSPRFVMVRTPYCYPAGLLSVCQQALGPVRLNSGLEYQVYYVRTRYLYIIYTLTGNCSIVNCSIMTAKAP
jgi:hypothetical protein